MAEQRTVRVRAVDSAEVLPTYAMVDTASGPHLFGWITETTVGGAEFLDVQMPKGHSRLLVNAHQVRTITVLTEEVAIKFAPARWRNGQ
jgi:hypothetical protein